MRIIARVLFLAAAGPRPVKFPGYAGVCLGNCRECHEYVDSLSTPPRYLMHSEAPVWRLSEFVTSTEVCDFGSLFPLNVDLSAYSLATMAPEVLAFENAVPQVRATLAACAAIRNSSIALLGAAFDALAASHLAAGARPRASTGSMLAQLRASNELPPDSPVANRTATVIAHHLSRALAFADGSGALRTYDELTDAAVALAAEARLLMDHARLVLALKNVFAEVGLVYPINLETAPEYRWHDFYGRHWDVLERLLAPLAAAARAEGRPLRMVEIGVACGPIGRFLLTRYPDMIYDGIDPTIVDEVYHQYRNLMDRATLHRNLSEEVIDLFSDKSIDLIFVDGPHTYKNVRQDIEMWGPKVRRGGILSGHDFTSGHPPLLWAVSEQRINDYLDVAMDGVWWFTVPY